MFQVKTPALVLDKLAGYNDDGKITLLTKDYGILKLTASGVYRQGASLGAWTEPPVSLVADIAMQEKSTVYGRLLTLSPREHYSYIRKDYQSLSWYYFFCFLLANFIPQGSRSKNAYELLLEVLGHKDSWGSSAGRDLNFIYFAVKLLKFEGICSGFNYCLNCEEEFKGDQEVYFCLGEEGILCSNCSKNIIHERKNRPIPKFSLDFLSFAPVKPLSLPEGLIRIRPEEKKVLEICEESEDLATAYTNIFSHLKINDQTIVKVRNFLLIFLAPLL